MRILANRTNLKKHAKTLLGNEWSEETEKLLIREALSGFVARSGHVSHARAEHLERLDSILHTCGVEGILEGDVDIQYCNTGDSYGMTLMYHDDELCIGDWGSIVEETVAE